MERNEGHGNDRWRNENRDLSSDRRGPDQTGSWQGAGQDQGRRSDRYEQRGDGQRRDERGTFGSRDRPGEYPHQGGGSVTGGETSHWGEGDQGRRAGGYGEAGGRHQGQPFGRNDEYDYRSRQYAGGSGYGSQYGEGGSYGGGIHRRDTGGLPDDGRYGERSGYGAGREAYGRSGGPQDYDRDWNGSPAGGWGGSSDWGRRPQYGEQGGYGERHWGENRYGGGRDFGSASSTWGRGSLPQYGGDSGQYGLGSGMGGVGTQSQGRYQDPQRTDPQRRRGPKNYQRTDDRLRELISDRLLDDPHIDSSDVSIEVKDGEVSLSGTVDDRRTKYQIEELVEQIYGVRDVDNRLKVRRGFLASLFGGDEESPERGEQSASSGTTGGATGGVTSASGVSSEPKTPGDRGAKKPG